MHRKFMSDFHYSNFFDISSFAHADLFEKFMYVWETLPAISLFLKEAKLGVFEIDYPAGAYIINPEKISVGKGTVIEPGAYIKGPCIIGERCTIRHGAYIRGNFISGNDCVIGHDTEIKNSIMLNGAHAAHFAYLGDTILGNKVNLGAGTKCANLRLDCGEISVHLEGKKYKTNLKKFGAIIGDGTQLGCNSVTNPGTLIGKSVQGYPCINFGGFIPSCHIIKPSAGVLITAI